MSAIIFGGHNMPDGLKDDVEYLKTSLYAPPPPSHPPTHLTTP
jgi:hypothetical protein